MIIHIDKLINSLKEVEWDYEFRITKRKDGSVTLSIPEFILRDLEWAIEPGNPTPLVEVRCKRFKSYE